MRLRIAAWLVSLARLLEGGEESVANGGTWVGCIFGQPKIPTSDPDWESILQEKVRHTGALLCDMIAALVEEFSSDPKTLLIGPKAARLNELITAAKSHFAEAGVMPSDAEALEIEEQVHISFDLADLDDKGRDIWSFRLAIASYHLVRLELGDCLVAIASAKHYWHKVHKVPT